MAVDIGSHLQWELLQIVINQENYARKGIKSLLRILCPKLLKALLVAFNTLEEMHA